MMKRIHQNRSSQGLLGGQIETEKKYFNGNRRRLPIGRQITQYETPWKFQGASVYKYRFFLK